MSRKKKKSSNQDKALKTIVLITAILSFIKTLIDFIETIIRLVK